MLAQPFSSESRAYRLAGGPALVRTRSRQRLVEQGVNPPSGERSSVMRHGYLGHGDRHLVLNAVWDHKMNRPLLAKEGWRERVTGSFDRSQVLAASVPPRRCSLASPGNPTLIRLPFGFDLKTRTLLMESCSGTLRLARINHVIRLRVTSHRTGGTVRSARSQSSRRVQAASSGLGTGCHG